MNPYCKVCVASSAEFVLLGPKWPFWFLTRTTRTIFTFVTTTRKRLQNLLIKTILQWRLMPSAGKTDLGVLSWQCWRWTKTEEIFSGWLKQIKEKRYINWQNWSWQMKYLLGFYHNISVLNEDRGNTFRLIKTNPQKSYISWQNWSRGARLAITLQWKRLLWLVWVGTNGGLSCHHWTEKEQGYYLGFCEIKRNASVIGCLNTFRLRIRSTTLGPNKGSLLTSLSSMSLVLI